MSNDDTAKADNPKIEVTIKTPDGKSYPATILPNPPMPNEISDKAERKLYRQVTIEEEVLILRASGPVDSLNNKLESLGNEVQVHRMNLHAAIREQAQIKVAFDAAAKGYAALMKEKFGVDAGDPSMLRRDGNALFVLDVKKK